MHIDDNASPAGGRRERTLVGYPPGPELPPQVAPPPPTDRVVQVSDGVPLRGLEGVMVEPAEDSGVQGAWGEAAGLTAAPPEPPALEPPALEPPDIHAAAAWDRRNPLSRRQPINRGRHLSKQFFEEGDRQQQTGWENSPLVNASEGADAAIKFDSFDQVARRRTPLIVAAAIGGVGLALFTAWGIGGQSSGAPNEPGVWSALQQQGAGWKPATPIPVAEAAPISAAKTEVALPPPPAPQPAPAAEAAVAPPVPSASPAPPVTATPAPRPAATPAVVRRPSARGARTAPASQASTRRSVVGARRNGGRAQPLRPPASGRARPASTPALKAGAASLPPPKHGESIEQVAPAATPPAMEAAPAVESPPAEARTLEAQAPVGSQSATVE